MTEQKRIFVAVRPEDDALVASVLDGRFYSRFAVPSKML